MHGYICWYKTTKIEVYADSTFDAQCKAAAQLKVPKKKQYMIDVKLAELNGKPYVHTAVD